MDEYEEDRYLEFWEDEDLEQFTSQVVLGAALLFVGGWAVLIAFCLFIVWAAA